jgi:hypothetical protein
MNLQRKTPKEPVTDCTKKNAALDLERVERELPAMTDPASVQRRVEVATTWACVGLISPGVASAIVRSAEAWHKLRDLELDRERVRGFEKRIRELEAELKRQTAPLGARGG